MRSPAMVVLALLAMSAFAGEQIDPRTWRESPEAQFMTTEERHGWDLLRSDDESRRFIEMFRRRHSADFLEEVARRAAVVDERLAMGEMKASRSLRGRIVMLLGAPAEVRARHIPKPYRGSIGVSTMGRSGSVNPSAPGAGGGGSEGWMEYTFRYAPRPELGIGEEGWTVVIETDVISGKDRVKNPRGRKRMEEILDAAARVSLRAD